MDPSSATKLTGGTAPLSHQGGVTGMRTTPPVPHLLPLAVPLTPFAIPSQSHQVRALRDQGGHQPKCE